MVGWLARSSLAEEKDVRHHGGAFASEGIGRQADRADEVGFRCQVLADGSILLVEREMAGDQGQHAAGLESIHGLGEEVIMQGELLPAIIELKVGERHIADDCVNAVLGQLRVAEVFDADVLAGVKRLGDPAGDGIHLDADERWPLACPGS